MKVLLVKTVKDSHEGKEIDNRGNPLYIACVLDMPEASAVAWHSIYYVCQFVMAI